MENYVEEHNTNQVSAESIKDSNDQQKQEIYCLTEEIKLIKSSVADLQVEAKTMSSEKNIVVSKLQDMWGFINAIATDLNSTRIKKEDSKEKIQKLKSVISEDSRS